MNCCFFVPQKKKEEGGFAYLSIHRHSVLILCFRFLDFMNLIFAKSFVLVVMLSFNVGAYIFMEKA